MIEYGRVAIERLDSRAPVEHRFLGRHSRRMWAAIAFLFAVVSLSLFRRATVAVDLESAGLAALTPAIDALADVVILTVALTVTALPVVYACWNGGPALSFAAPVFPVLVGDLLGGSYVLDLDVAVAISVGAVAAAVAVYAADVRETRSPLPWRAATDENALWLVTGTTALALVVGWRFTAAMPEHVLEWYAPFGLVLAVPVAVVFAYWLGWGWRAMAAR